MPFWLDPFWFGDRATEGGGTRLPAVTGIVFGVPVHTRLIDVLTEELPNVQVWPDADLSPDGSGDSVVVQNIYGDSITQAQGWIRRSQTMRITCFSSTSDGAERLLDQAITIVKRRHDSFNFISAVTSGGGYERESETFYRSFDVTFRGRA